MNKSEIIKKIQSELSQSRYERVLLFGLDNIRYVAGGVLPFLGTLENDKVAVFLQRNEEPILIAPSWLKDTLRSIGRIRNVQVYTTAIEDVLPILIRRFGLENAEIGISEKRISYELYNSLQKILPKVSFSGCDQWITNVRMVKTEGEQELLEEVARKTDHGLSGAAHHVMVYAPRPEKGLSEIIRVHCIERELDMVGYESLSIGASGEHTHTPWPEAPFFGVGRGKYLEENELVRMEIRASLHGYWSDAARMLTMGSPTAEQANSYQQVVAIRKKALSLLRPGIAASDVASELLGFCEANTIPVIKEHGFGHGIGVVPIEPPFIDVSDPTVLKNGMVLVINPTVKGSSGELVRSYDTVIIGPTSSRLVGWYKNWDEPYKAVASYQHGGG